MPGAVLDLWEQLPAQPFSTWDAVLLYCQLGRSNLLQRWQEIAWP